MAQKVTSSNIITGLPKLRWRGLEAPPYDVANFSGGHRLPEREYPYVDGVGHDTTGRKAIPMSFKLYFLNTLRKNMFPELFGDWYQAFALDGTSGDLEHPWLGPIRARPVDWSVELTAQRTAGVLMEVTFTDTIDDLSAITKPGGVISIDLQSVAAQADKDIANLGISYPTGERTDSLLDLMKQIESLLFSTRLSIQGMINQAVGIVDGLVDSIDSLHDHRAWAASVNLKQLRNSLVDLAEAVGAKVRKTKLVVVQHRTSLDAMATTYKNTVGELITLNPSLIANSMIEPLTTVKVFVE